MSGKFQFGLIARLVMSMAIAMVELNSISSSALSASKPTLQSLPNGDYFYGESRSPNISGARYLIFRKHGQIIIGRNYIDHSDEWTCFRGKANGLKITNITAGIQPIPVDKGSVSWEFSPSVAIDLSKFSRLLFNQAPANMKQGFQTCVQLFQNQ